jgi:hypothetical protein
MQPIHSLASERCWSIFFFISADKLSFCSSRSGTSSHIPALQVLKVGEQTSIDFILGELGRNFFVLICRQQRFDNREQDAVFLVNVISDARREAVGKKHKLRVVLRAERVFQTFDERALLIMLEQHMAQRPTLRLAGPRQLWEKRTLFLEVVLFVGKRAEKMQKAEDVVTVGLFTVLDMYRHLLENIEGAENDPVILHEKVCALHAEPPLTMRCQAPGFARRLPNADRPQILGVEWMGLVAPGASSDVLYKILPIGGESVAIVAKTSTKRSAAT